MLIRRIAAASLIAVACLGAFSVVAHASDTGTGNTATGDTATGNTVAIDPNTGLPAARGPLVAVPASCTQPPKAMAVIEGTVLSSFAGVVQFRVGRLLAGDLTGHSTDQMVEVHYGDDARYLVVGQRYLVGVVVESSTGFLLSTVREPAPLFGGDAVVGRNETSVKCPVVADPARTLLTDGTAIDTGVLAPLRSDRRGLAKALLLPAAIAFGALFVATVLKLLVQTVFKGVRDMAEQPPRRGQRYPR